MMPGSMKPGVAVVGGGWAGCAAALTLAEAGVAVTLYEASHTLGGRARAVELEGQALDNGQHILLGAYEQTLQLIERLHPAAMSDGLWRLPLTLTQPPDFSLTCPRLPAPLHLLAGLLGAQGLSWREKLAAARWAHALLNQTDTPDHLSVSQFTRSQPEKLSRLLWHPLCVSALNTPPETASAQVFRDVIRAAFGGRNQHSDLLLPRRDLTALFPAPAAARVIELGGAVRLASRVTALDADNGCRHTRHPRRQAALQPRHPRRRAAASVRPGCAGPATRIDACVMWRPTATNPSPPATCNTTRLFDWPSRYSPWPNGPAQFVFDRGQSHGQAGLLAFVASAATNLSADWLDQAEAQLQRIAQPGPPRWRKRIVEKQATYACVPDMARPTVRTAHPRIFLAGDYIAGPYPATLESATLSGVQSAGAILEQL